MSGGDGLHGAVGGDAFFERLVERFYEGVAGDEVLLPLYPERDDLSAARRRLAMFLVQYWGGSGAYSEERGHPRLRMRHAPFAIGAVERDRWMVHMLAALDATAAERAVAPELRDEMADYFARAAEHMVNRAG
ncbi:MAG: globin [Acidobacteria bacterium]|nr:globin [Acidobacteriota bacterium]